MNLTNIILIVAFAIGIWATLLTIGKIIYRNTVKFPFFIIMALAWTTIITYYIGLWSI